MRNLILILVFILSELASAEAGFYVIPGRGMDLNGTVISTGTTTSRENPSRIQLILNCYATNLRGTPNPLSGQSTIISYLDFIDSSGALKTLVVRFPASMSAVTDNTQVAANVVHDTATLFPDVQVAGMGNTITILVPGLSTATVNADGSVNVNERLGLKSLQTIRFDQLGAPNAGQYFGSDGPLSGAVNWSTSPDGRNIVVHASFPGAAFVGQGAVYLGETRTGFCGGYYSPLMMFFDEKRPAFTGKSHFQLTSNSSEVYWVEPNAPGYFLALDKNANGRIDSGDELFGNQSSVDGFAALSAIPHNGGWITPRDKIFKKLLLWQDKNGDGVSQPNEIFHLSDLGVTRIKVEPENVAGSFGDRAKYAKQAVFEYRKNGRLYQGKILDIWFSATPASSALASK